MRYLEPDRGITDEAGGQDYDEGKWPVVFAFGPTVVTVLSYRKGMVQEWAKGLTWLNFYFTK